MDGSEREQQPLLLPSGHDDNNHHIGAQSSTTRLKFQTKRYLTSKTGHYSVLALVSLDVLSIFTEFVLQLLTCEGRLPADKSEKAEEALGIVGLIFSCLFVLELVASLWAFGWRAYLSSKFHIFDGTVILAGFVVDVLLKGVLEEVGSLVITLRLWRVFKIIEELSVGAQEQTESMAEKIEVLEQENKNLRRELGLLKAKARET